MRPFITVLILVFSLLISLLPMQPSLAADFDYSIATTYTLEVDGSVSARSIVDVVNNVDSPTPNAIVLPVGGAVTDATAAYQDGGDIKANYSADNSTLRLETTSSQAGQGNRWSVVVNYTVDLVQKFGDTTIVSIPPLDYGNLNIQSETLTLEVDLSDGVAIARGPTPDSSRIIAGKQVLKWSSATGTITDAVGVMFGENAVADVRFETQLKNESWWWKDVTLTLPPDTNQQQAFLEELSPQPSKVELDVDGNILASYNLRPRQSIEVKTRSTIVVNNFAYATSEQIDIDQAPEQIRNRYTSLVGEWQDTDINVDIAGKQSADAIEAIYDALVNDASKIEDFDQALMAANKLIGELRANSIPARLVLGKVFGDGGSVFEEPVAHAWVEAYAAGIGWMSLDPAFELNGEYFGNTDVQHVGLALRGNDPNYPPILIDEISVNYTDNDVPAPPDMTPQVSGTSHVILPFLSIQSVSVQLPEGIIVDGAGVAIGSNSAKLLGSLSPFQKVSLRSVVFGPDAFSSSKVSYGSYLNGEISEATANAQIKVSYIPLILIVVISVLAFAIRWWWRRRKGVSKKTKRSRDAVVFAKEAEGSEIEDTNLLPKQGPPIPVPPENVDQQLDLPSTEKTPEGTTPYRSDTMSQTADEPDTPHRKPRRRRIQ